MRLTLLNTTLTLLTITVAAITGAVVWQVMRYETQSPQPLVEGAAIQVGLPVSPAANRTLAVSAASAVLWDSDAGAIRFEQNAFARVPIASITKLMTAMVALDHGMPWEHAATIDRSEYGLGGQLLLHPGETVTMRDLFAASIIGSANNATLAYVRQLGVEPAEFVREMNRKAVAIGLEQTQFVEVTGLDTDNISTAYEVARLAEYAFAHYPEIAALSSQPEYSFTIGGSGRAHTMRNTNKLISEQGQTFLGSKTGYLYEAQYCLVVRGAGEQSHLIGVVLGSASEPENMAAMQQLLHFPLP